MAVDPSRALDHLLVAFIGRFAECNTMISHDHILGSTAGGDGDGTALVLLNTPRSTPRLLQHVWSRCSRFRIAADGAAVRLYDGERGRG